MKLRVIMLSLLAALFFMSCKPGDKDGKVVKNPMLPGYFADPSIVYADGKYYLYVTTEPWGQDFLSCWVSDDFESWTFHKLNWPTKQLCTTDLSTENMVWAPSVVRYKDRYYMYVSVGSEIWCGVAEHPLGPWKNALGDRPLVGFDQSMYYHVIDSEVFVDDDGKAYLYWGSGWNWVNGHCYAAELNEDMCSFKTEPREVTPANYFEAPLMLKHNEKYYLTYSDGKTLDDTYKVRYAVGDSPYGPFTEAANSPILVSDSTKKVYGPGHHAVVQLANETYILYHKHRIPFQTGTACRQLCINQLEFDDSNHQIRNIQPDDSVIISGMLPKAQCKKISVIDMKASSQSQVSSSVENLTDNNYQTLWKPNRDDAAPWVYMQLEQQKQIDSVQILFEYPWKNYALRLETSIDGIKWSPVFQRTDSSFIGSPYTLPLSNVKCNYLRFMFGQGTGVWEIKLFAK